MKPRCKKHKSPMFEQSDGITFAMSHFCRACELEKKAKHFYRVADIAMDEGDIEKCTRFTEKAQIAEGEAVQASGRWFECVLNGAGRDMSEGDIEVARARGSEVKVLTEII